jgi:glycosyltransferase involved in cell wall biosynthesis
MKQVWMVNHYAQSPSNCGGTRHFNFARYLTNYGWEASIIASSVELNSARQLVNDDEPFRYEKIEGTGFLRIRVPSNKENGVRRIVVMVLFALKACLPKYTRCLPRPDVVVGSTVHPFAALAGYILAVRYKVPFFFEVRDLWPQTLIDIGYLRENSFVTKALRYLELFLARKATRIITLLPKAADYFGERSIGRNKIIWIPNGVDLEDFPKASPLADQKKEIFTLLYFGAHGKANGLHNLIAAMAILKDDTSVTKIKLRFVGDGPEKNRLMQQAKDLQLEDRIEFLPPVQKKDIYKLCQTASAFVFNLANISVFKYGISSNKLFDYMAGGKPVIFCCEAANNPVAESGSGLTVTPEDPKALADAIVKLYLMPIEVQQQMGSAGRSYVEANHDFNLLSQRLAGEMACSLQERSNQGFNQSGTEDIS